MLPESSFRKERMLLLHQDRILPKEEELPQNSGSVHPSSSGGFSTTDSGAATTPYPTPRLAIYFIGDGSRHRLFASFLEVNRNGAVWTA